MPAVAEYSRHRSTTLATRGQAIGPYAAEQRGEFVGQGAIRSNTLVWIETLQTWEPASAVRGLFQSSGAPSPPPLLPLSAQSRGTGLSVDPEEVPSRTTAVLLAFFLGSLGAGQARTHHRVHR
ncbi:MAG: GYF domain-containing protein [Lacipirellulaceae bacterium]